MVRAAEEEDGMPLPEQRGRSSPIASSDEPSPCCSLCPREWVPLGCHRVPLGYQRTCAASPPPPSSSQIIPKVASFPRLGVGKPLDGNVTCSLAASPGDGAGPGVLPGAGAVLPPAPALLGLRGGEPGPAAG